IQEHVGGEFVRGNWHEALGVVMVLLGLGLIVGLAGLLSGRANPDREGGGGTSTPAAANSHPLPHGRGSPRFAALPLALSAAAAVAAQFLGAGAERELVAAAPLEQLPHQSGHSKGTDEPIPDQAAAMLTPDAA